MTLIIDMASGTPYDDTVISRTSADPVTNHRLDMPAAEPGLILIPVTSTRATTGMPVALADSDIAAFLDGMD